MKRERKSPTNTFAVAGSQEAPEISTAALPGKLPKPPTIANSPHAGIEKGMRQISLTVSKDLYDRIAKEAANKNRTIEEHLQKHLHKRYQK